MSEWKPTSLREAIESMRPQKVIPHSPESATKTKIHFWRIFAIVALVAACILGFINASKNRYRAFADECYILDTWTGKVYDIDQRFVKIETELTQPETEESQSNERSIIIDEAGNFPDNSDETINGY